jgi:excisionase family DNA binding protein
MGPIPIIFDLEVHVVLPPQPELCPPLPRTWTPDDVADYARLNRRTVLKLADQGAIPGIRLGKQWRFDPQKVVALFDVPEA